MFKAGDKILVKRLETTRRQRDVKKDGVGEDWIDSKPVMVKHKATIGRLEQVLIPILYPDGSIHQKPYPILTFGKDGKVSWKSKKADHVKMVDHKETFVKGKEYILRGVIAPDFKSLHIPVILNDSVVSIPLSQVVFKEKK